MVDYDEGFMAVVVYGKAFPSALQVLKTAPESMATGTRIPIKFNLKARKAKNVSFRKILLCYTL